MRICTILGKGYEEIEAIGTLALLKRSGLEADLFGISGEKTSGKHDLPICGLLALDELQPEKLRLPASAGRAALCLAGRKRTSKTNHSEIQRTG